MANHLTRYDPFGEMLTLRNAMDRLFQSAYGSTGDQEALSGLDVDLFEEGDNLVVKAAMPGVDPQDIDVTIQNNVLTIRGEVQEEKEDQPEARGRWHRRERRYGSFFRRIELPVAVDSEGARARCKNGIVTLTLPKAEGARERRIEVQGGESGAAGGRQREIQVEGSGKPKGEGQDRQRLEAGRKGERAGRR